VVKIIDFGVSKILSSDLTQSYVGSPLSMAPEVLSGQKYCKMTDVYSLGVVAYVLL
jgi:serine/threonine protein kinase